MKHPLLRNLLALALLAMACTLAACNTTRGFGRDMEDAGESIQKGAK